MVSAHLEEILRHAQVKFELIQPGVPTPTVEAAASALGTEPDAIVKSILFVGKNDAAVLVIARGPARIDTKKVAALSGVKRPRLASPEIVRDRTGYPAGGTPPVGHKERIPVIMDRRVLQRDVVFAGGGSREMMLRIAPADILRLTGAQVADVAE